MGWRLVAPLQRRFNIELLGYIMRILMVNSYYYLRGGAERCVFELSDLLTANGHEVIPFAMQHPQNLPTAYAEYFTSQVDFPSLLGKGSTLQAKWRAVERVIYSRETKTQIERLIEATQPDVAHIHGIAHEVSPSILPALQQAGIPVVQTLHDFKLLCPNTSFVSQNEICERCKGHHYFNVVRYRCKRDSFAASLLAGVEAYVHQFLQIYEKNVDTFITPSRFLEQKLREHGINNPIAHLPNFIDGNSYQPWYEPEPYLLYAGRLVDIKGVRTLLTAMRGLPTVPLYLAGTGELEAELRTIVAEQKLDNVTFLGHLEKQALTELMQRALCTIVPSEWYENYPMSILESFACGTPVIGSRIGGIPELVRDGESGLLFEPRNANDLRQKITELVDQRDLAIQMGKNARRQVEIENNPDAHYQAMIQLYQTLINKQCAELKLN